MNHFLSFWVRNKKQYDNMPYAFCCIENDDVKFVSYASFLDDILRNTNRYCRFPQKRIGIWGENSYEWLVTAFSLLSAGKSLILLDAKLQNEDMKNLATYADCEMIVASEELMEEKEYFARLFPFIEMVTECDETSDEKLYDEAPEGEQVYFTSGTSASSKAVVLSAADLIDWIKIKVEHGILQNNSRNRWFIPVPFHHAYGFEHVITALMKAAAICIGSGPRYLIQDMRKYNPDIAILVPTMAQFLLERDAFPGSVKEITTAGGPCSVELEMAAKEKGITLYNIFGGSEINGTAGISEARKGVLWLKPVGNVCWVQKDDGELGICHNYLMKGYYKKPDETDAVLSDGTMWLGDAGEIDDEGYVRIQGRIRDTIVLRNGKKVHAGDLERDLESLPDIVEAIAVGNDGILTVVVVPQKGVTDEMVQKQIAELNREKPVSQHIRKVIISRKPLPRTTLGKKMRYKVEETCSEWSARETS